MSNNRQAVRLYGPFHGELILHTGSTERFSEARRIDISSDRYQPTSPIVPLFAYADHRQRQA